MVDQYQACANHEKIAEDLSEAFCKINEIVVDCKVDQCLFTTPEILGLIADLYANIFLFLASIMDWLMEKRYKRMLDSFNETFSKRFDKEVDSIKNKAERIRNRAAQSSRAESRSTRLTVEDIKIELKKANILQREADVRQRKHIQIVEQTFERGWRKLVIAMEQQLQQLQLGATKDLRADRAPASSFLVHTSDDAAAQRLVNQASLGTVLVTSKVTYLKHCVIEPS